MSARSFPTGSGACTFGRTHSQAATASSTTGEFQISHHCKYYRCAPGQLPWQPLFSVQTGHSLSVHAPHPPPCHTQNVLFHSPHLAHAHGPPHATLPCCTASSVRPTPQRSPPLRAKDFKQSIGDFTHSVFVPGSLEALTATTDGDLVVWDEQGVTAQVGWPAWWPAWGVWTGVVVQLVSRWPLYLSRHPYLRFLLSSQPGAIQGQKWCGASVIVSDGTISFGWYHKFWLVP